jgi:hypothetical protein
MGRLGHPAKSGIKRKTQKFYRTIPKTLMAALVVTKSERTCPKRPSKNPFDKIGHDKTIPKIILNLNIF